MNSKLAAALLLVLIVENPVLAFDTTQFKVPDSNFPIPSGAIFVAPNGNDANAGTQAAPLLTPAAAVKKAVNGSTIVVRAGVYYEVNLGTVSKKITLQAYPHEQVHFLGSKPATGWTKEQTYWRTAWTNPLASQDIPECPKEVINPAYPNACLPEQVFVAGAPLAQVTTKAEVVAGKFFMDSANNVLYIGSDPTSKLVEVGTLTRGLQFAPGAEGSRVLGIGFAQYSNYWGGSGVLVSYSNDVTIDLCSFVQNAFQGLGVNAENQIVRSSVFSYNGQNGIGCNKCHGSLIEWNYIAFNNQEHFATSKCGGYCTIAGMKVAHVDRLTVNMNNFYRNNAGGLWFDLGCTNAMVTRNLFKENGDGVAMNSGLFYEVSSTGTVASNAFIKNKGNGIQISGSDRTRIYNNNFVKNQVDITARDDTRTACGFETYSCQLNLTWDTTGTVVRNNLFSNNLLYGIDSVGISDQVPSSNLMFSNIDHNGWYRANTTGLYLVRWCPTSTCTRYKTHTNFQEATNLDWAPPSIGVRDTPNNPFFVDEDSEKLSLKSDSSARSAGTALPADIAAYLGVPASPIDMGALTYRDKVV
ncbi:right handed beta helix region domain-containing protein [Ditylenchus destructor]|uniref:Right handed beta helix region domain-containing protein n=1 Tax=Ditylenchus destructor TaxID=166010 RepID=A0AAD4MNE5_9BILA|nr:right handed beta helix region domain-containing protein [Ditylenchus destructor]